MNSRRAFTLIELLVVVAIIAILAALLFTVFGKASQDRSATQSVSNLKQWHTALNASLGDFDGRMPTDGLTGTGADLKDENAWFNRLPKYLKVKPLNHPDYEKNPPKFGDRSIWINPGQPKDDIAIYNKPPESYVFCYAMNDYLSSGSEKSQPASRIERTAATIFMGEMGMSIPAIDPKQVRAYYGPGKDTVGDPENGAHFLFMDGHVELLKRPQFDPTFMKDKPPTDPDSVNNTELNQHVTFIPYVGAVK